MTIEELKDKHFYISHQHKKSHTKLSIQFAISVLEEIDQKNMDILGNSLEYYSIYPNIENKIQELKQYLDDKS